MEKELAIRFSEESKINIEQILREWWEIVILRDLLSSPIGGNLVFKGGTALRLVYNSPRFSEDLDFSILAKFPFEAFKNAVSLIGKRYPELEIKDLADKFYTYIAQYRIKEPWRPLAMSVKIEVSKRDLIEDKARYGISIVKSRISNIEALGNVMTIERIYEEKLDALKTRNAPRDLFDIWYLSNVLKIPYKRRKVNFDKKTLVRDLRKYLPKNYWQVLDGLIIKE
jgi:predicted nucleotidyltransferase component of viral defense system